MADNHNMKKAVKALMKARAMGIVWKLLLQIILDRPTAIVNAWNKLDKRPDPCPAKVWQCPVCKGFVAYHVGESGQCDECAKKDQT